VFQLTGKRKILPDVSKVSIGDQSSLPKTTLALAVLALQQVASPLFPTKNFPSSSDFETLGNGFPCFCFSSDSWHGTGKLGIAPILASQNWHDFFRKFRMDQAMPIPATFRFPAVVTGTSFPPL
jgi:hypothetical protein